MTVVFVYGTLTNPTQVSRLLDEYSFGPEVVCHGLQRVEGRYPTLVPGGQVAGRLLSTPETERLDSYEGVDRGLYCRVSVPLAADWPQDAADNSVFTADTVEIYIGDPAVLDVSEDTDWPDGGSFRQCVNECIQTNNISIDIQSQPETGTDDH